MTENTWHIMNVMEARDARRPNMLSVDHEFVDAAIKNDYVKMRNLLQAGANPRYDVGGFAIWKAAGDGQIDLVHFLLAHGADPNSSRGLPIRAAVENGHLEVVKILLDKGGRVDEGHSFPLRLAARAGALDMIDLLLERGAEINKGALDWAAQHGQIEAVRHLIAKGAKVRDCLALYYAATGGYTEILSLLLREGANVEYDNYVALAGAAHGGHIEIVRLLLAKGAPREAKIRAAERAQQKHHMEIARLLYE